MTPVLWQRSENALIAGLLAFATVQLDFAWWWLLALFLAFDLWAIGYLHGPRVGAWGYNAVHSYGAPAALFATFLVTDVRWLGVLALAWGFHVAIDRALGYGLKHSDAFEHTHLGWLPGARRDT